jgi:hypothetical protein
MSLLNFPGDGSKPWIASPEIALLVLATTVGLLAVNRK